MLFLAWVCCGILLVHYRFQAAQDVLIFEWGLFYMLRSLLGVPSRLNERCDLRNSGEEIGFVFWAGKVLGLSLWSSR